MTSAIIIGFDSIVIFSFLFGLLVLSTALLSPKVQRQPTWYGFLAPMFIYDVILLFGVGYQTDSGPPARFCTFQAVLLYSIPGWAVVGFGCFMIAFYLYLTNLIAAEEEDDAAEPRTLSKRARTMLTLTPLLSFIGFLLLNGLTIALDENRPSATLNQYKLYCTPKTYTGLYIGGAIMGVGMLMWIIVIAKAGVLFRRHYSRIRARGEVVFHEVLSVFIRTTAISIAGSIVIGLYVSSYATKNADNVLSSYCLCLPSIIIFFAFGTQRDIIQSWAFWRNKPTLKRQISSSFTSSSFGQMETGTFTSETETKMHGNWKKIGYNWNSKTESGGVVLPHSRLEV